MQVERYLGKYGGPVFTVSPDTSVAECARRFGHLTGGKRYSVAVVVDADQRVAGIVSLGDIVYAVGQHEGGAAAIKVSDIMTRDVLICGVDSLLEEVLRQMAERGVRHAPVVQDGKLAGLVARREALEFLYQWAQLDVDNLTGWLFSSHARY
ncbi:MAG: CBS domain-containing protein [Rhodospirillales bacterium]|nr:MAG: CBS domain-containing protein [Rhodospirillales bacterium]